MPKIKTRTVSIDSLIPDPKNARKRDATAKAALEASVGQFGAARSLVMDADGVVRAGSGTLEAARAAGIKDAVVIETDGSQLVVVKRPDWTPEQALAYALSDNRTGELSEWDAGILSEALADLEGSDFHFDEPDIFEGMISHQADEQDDFDFREWSSEELEISAIFEFRAPIELQAKIREVLQREFPDALFEESVLVG